MTTNTKHGPVHRAITVAWLVLCGNHGDLVVAGSRAFRSTHSASIPITVAVDSAGLRQGPDDHPVFMEVRISAPVAHGGSTDLWLAVLWTSILVIYLW